MTSNTEQPTSLADIGDEDIIRALISAIATVTLVGVGLSLTLALLALRLAEQGFSAGAIGFHSTAGGLAVMAGAAMVPSLVRRYRIRPLLVLALVTSGLCLLSFTLTQDYWAWLLIRTLFAWALSILFVTSEYWINAVAPPRQRGMVLGFYLTSLSGGFALGPFILGFVGTQGAAPFLVATAIFALAALPVLLRGGQPPEIEDAPAVPVLHFFTRFPAATFAGLLYGAIETASLGLLPVYALRAGLSPQSGAFLATLFAFGNLIFQFPIGFASDRMNRNRLLLIIASLSLVLAFAMGVAGTEWFLFFSVLLVLWGGIIGSLYAVGLALLGSHFSGPDLAGANAAYIMLYSVGMLAGPPIMGLGLDLYPPGGFFYTLAALLLLYLMLVSLSGRGTTQAENLFRSQGRTHRHG